MSEWIKIELVTPDKPEIHGIAATLNLDPDAVFGKCFRVWAWFDQHTVDGNAVSVTKTLVDRIAGVAGFADAMGKVGWLTGSAEGLQLPHFDRHNGKTAKTRALTALRVKRKRNADGNDDVTRAALPRERIRNNPLQSPVHERFEQFWTAYPRRRGKGDAERAFAKLKPDEALFECILLALERQKKSNDWCKDGGQFIPYPATWLNRRGWEDEVETSRASEMRLAI